MAAGGDPRTRVDRLLHPLPTTTPLTMCGRYTLTTPPEIIAQVFGVKVVPAFPPRYNIAPTQFVPVVRLTKDRSDRECALLRWGLVPFWATAPDDPQVGAKMINARAESVAEKPAFKQALEKRRCLIPADGFFEWKKLGEAEGSKSPPKQPYLLRLKGGGLFAFAGLWERWKDPESGDKLDTFTIVTTRPNEIAGALHDRMPVMLEPKDFARWLDPAVQDAEALKPLLEPIDSAKMESHPVSPRINRPESDDASLVQPVAERKVAEQRSLFG